MFSQKICCTVWLFVYNLSLFWWICSKFIPLWGRCTCDTWLALTKLSKLLKKEISSLKKSKLQISEWYWFEIQMSHFFLSFISLPINDDLRAKKVHPIEVSTFLKIFTKKMWNSVQWFAYFMALNVFGSTNFKFHLLLPETFIILDSFSQFSFHFSFLFELYCCSWIAYWCRKSYLRHW